MSMDNKYEIIYGNEEDEQGFMKLLSPPHRGVEGIRRKQNRIIKTDTCQALRGRDSSDRLRLGTQEE